MRLIKLGNTMFAAELIQGAAINEAPDAFQGLFKFRVTIYLNSDSLKAVSYPCKTREEADKVVAAIIDNSKVIDVEELTGLTPPTKKDLEVGMSNPPR